MPRLAFQTQQDWEQALERIGLDVSGQGVKLSTGATLLETADDFNDGIIDSKWKTHVLPSALALDQSFDLNLTNANYSNLNVDNLFLKFAQTFTPSRNISVTQMALALSEWSLYDAGPGVGVRLDIVTTDGQGKPTSTVLASVTKWRRPPDDSFGDWYSDAEQIGPSNANIYWIKFPINVSLQANTKYALVLNAIYPMSAWRYVSFWGDGVSGNNYAGGNSLRFDGSSQTWQTNFIMQDFYFRLYESQMAPLPVTESGGLMRFEYSQTSGSGDHRHIYRDFAQGDVECETRFILTRLASTFNTGFFSFGLLQDPSPFVVEDWNIKNQRLIWDISFSTTDNGITSFVFRVKGSDGLIHRLGDSDFPIVQGGTARILGTSTTLVLQVTKRPGGKIKVKIFLGDNPSDVFIESGDSPVLVTPTSKIYLEIGGVATIIVTGTAVAAGSAAFGVRYDFDYFKLSGQPQEVATGFLRLRHSFGVPTALNSLEIKRSKPVAGDKVDIQLRSGNTIAEMEAAAFGTAIATTPGSFDPGNPQDSFEKAVLSNPQAKFFETKIILTRASPSPTLEGYFLDFTPQAAEQIVEEEKPPLTYRRHIQSDDDWGQAVEKSASIRIDNGAASIAPVFQDLFDQFVIEPHWTIYQRNANAFASLGFLRMEILSTDSDAILVKSSSIPTSFKATVRWKVENPFVLPSGSNFFFNIFAVYNKPSIPTPFDIRFGGSPSTDTHHTIIIRWTRSGDGQHRLGLVALRNDGTFVGWNQATGQWSPAAGDQIIPSGKEATLWTFEIQVAGGVLSITAKDDEGAIRFQTSGLSIKISDSQPWMVLGDSDSSFMPANTTQLYDSVETDIPVTGASNGFIRFRDSLGARGRLGNIKVIPTVNIQFDPGEVVLKARSGDTLENLLAATFKESSRFVPSVNGNEVDLAIAPGSFIEVELDMFSASPGPEIQFLSWEIEPLIEDNPVIFSLDPIAPDAQAVASGINTGNTSEGQATAPLAFDGDPTTQWESASGQEGFNVIWFYTLHLKKNGQSFEETIDTLIFLNTNIGSIQVELHRLGFSESKVIFKGEILTPDAIIRFDPFPVAIIEIQIFSSQVPNEKKRIGEILAGRLLLALPGFDKYEPKRELVESGQMRALGGKLIVFRGRDKYSSRWQATQLPQELKDQILKVFRENPLVTFWPEPKFRTRDFFDVAWRVEEIPFPYTDVVKGAGHTLESEMTEV
ncbi:MAG: hypothetical protein HYT79_02580 [Elusimicrobia bacterium]|nr:hypothetical protein [Elusimicrobiota bacterium]